MKSPILVRMNGHLPDGKRWLRLRELHNTHGTMARGRSLPGIGKAKIIAALAAIGIALASGAALADKIKHPTAVFAGLDKITGRIISFEVAINETVQFGSLHITPKICYTRPPTEAPQTTSFVEVEEIIAKEKFKKIFGGWMFAASPGLHGVEHPVYDAWLTDCKGGTKIIKTAKRPDEIEDDQPSKAEPDKKAAKPTRKTRAERRRERARERREARRAARRNAPRARRRPSQSFFPQNPGRRQPRYRHPLDVNPFGNY